jgi:hypothetical protein
MSARPALPIQLIQTRGDIPGWCAAKGFMLMAEVGVREGKHLKSLLRAKPKLLAAVDIWRDDGDPAHNDRGESPARIERHYQGVLDIASTYPAVKVIREYSDKAAAQFPDGFFDFVYLDADHRYESVVADIAAWWPKVRSGGVLAGHDYIQTTVGVARVRVGVIQAVTEFCERHRLALHTTAAAEKFASWFTEKP